MFAARLKRILAVGAGVIAGYLMTLGVVDVINAWGWLPDRATERAAGEVAQVMRLLNRHYADADAVRAETLSKQAIEGMLKSLDRYTTRMDAAGYKHFEEEVDGEFGGIGVQVEEVDEQVRVVAPIAGTPGDRAGMLRGDVLLRVDGESMNGRRLEDFIKRLRGRPGTKVTVTVLRGTPGRELEFQLEREVIRVESVRDVAMLDERTGYVRVTVFGEKTGREFKAAIKKLRAEGARALVLDLRNNPGGLITAAVEVAEPFFARGELVVYVEGRNPGSREELRARDNTPPWEVPLAILVNGGSASASEIVAGALRDTRQATLIGEKTFGKGSVQTIYPLSDKGALRLTSGRYFTPAGVIIHERGLEPDVVVPLSPEQEKAVFLTRLRPELANDPDAFAQRFGVSPAEDTQLTAALVALRAELDAPTGTPQSSAP